MGSSDRLSYKAVVLLAICGVAAADSVIDLRDVDDGGIVVLDSYSGEPDGHGVFKTYQVKLPAFEKAVYYRGGWWPAGGNRVYGEIVDGDGIGDVAEGGMFLLVRVNKDSYLAMLPICGPIAYSWFNGIEDELCLNMGTHGTAAIAADIPLYSWAKADGPYEACYEAWRRALDCEEVRGRALMREKKEYPDVLRYLGWCSWEQYHGRINEQILVDAMRNIEGSGLPVRYILIDDGHFDQQSLAPNATKFPNGYRRITAMRKPDKIRWVGIWYAFLGGSHGVKTPGKLGQLDDQLLLCKAQKLLPKDSNTARRAFYEYMFDYAKKDDLDFVKTDFQTDALPFYAGTPHGNPLRGLPEDNSDAVGNPLAMTAELTQMFQTVVSERMKGLINCNWHNAVSLFNSQGSVVGRCSEDYGKNQLGSAKRHLYHSYAAIPWLGQIAWGDHDMFHSNDKFAGRMMAVSKALSGGPVYLSDAPTEFKGDVIRPLCYENGQLLRPVAPAAPVRDSLFVKVEEERLYKVVAPLTDSAVSVVVYNFFGGVGENERRLIGRVDRDDYAQGGGMIQPYAGMRQIPDEGIAVYDWYEAKGRVLGAGMEVAITGFGDRLFQLSAIVDGWSVVGRCDKYLSAAAVEVPAISKNELTVRMVESGPLVLYSSTGRPVAEGLEFEALGGGFFRANMTVGERDKVVTITRGG